jgi:4-diphosphocytidyl-2-C-methyl-D-erythritol kinase
MIHEKAYAKINLGLQVLNKRDDGYHNLKSIMTTIDLHDDLFIGIHNDIIVDCDKPVCRQEDNLVYKVAVLMHKKYNVKKGTKIHIGKNIKVGGGLAGGSTNAAAAIRGLDKLWGLNLSYNDMYEIAKVIGSDVTFCIQGGLATVSERGDIINPLPYELDFYIVLVYPTYSNLTVNIFKSYQPNHDNNNSKYDDLYWEVITNDVHNYAKYLFNDLETTVDSMHFSNKNTNILSIKKNLLEAGCLGAVMTGSGSTVYGLVDNFDDARNIAQKLKRIYPNYNVDVTHSKRKALT